MSSVELGADCLELKPFELVHAPAAPAFGGADQRRVHQLQDGALAEGMRDHLGAPPLFAEQALEEIRGADRPAMRERELQMRDACLEVVVETRNGRR